VAARWRSILLTPNVLGKDGGLRCRARSRALPEPALIISLHDAPVAAVRSPAGLEVQGARGSRGAFLFSALQAARRSSRDVTIACSHLHLAPVARAAAMLAGRGARPTVVLCGIEAWVTARPLERWALHGSNVTAISSTPSIDSGRRIGTCGRPGDRLPSRAPAATRCGGAGAWTIADCAHRRAYVRGGAQRHDA
jgi:hypothetical protein